MNSGHYTICPFYIANGKSTIHCEDVMRDFDSKDTRHNHMITYCDSEWECCEYAMSLLAVYECPGRSEELMQELKAKSTATELTKARRKNIGLERENESLKDEIKKLRRKNKMLEDRARDKDSLVIKLKKDNKLIGDYVNHSLSIYQSRLAYLIDKYESGELDDAAVQEAMKNKEFQLTNDNDGNGVITRWKAVIQDVTEK